MNPQPSGGTLENGERCFPGDRPIPPCIANQGIVKQEHHSLEERGDQLQVLGDSPERPAARTHAGSGGESGWFQQNISAARVNRNREDAVAVPALKTKLGAMIGHLPTGDCPELVFIKCYTFISPIDQL